MSQVFDAPDRAAGGRGAEPSLVGATADGVLALMRAEGLKAGQELPSEMGLAKRFGVSRPIVREALRSLAALSLIDVGSGRRPRVRVPDGNVLGLIVDHSVRTEHVSIQQIYDVRRTVEMRTVELAAMRRSDEEARRIARTTTAMADSSADPDRLMELDIAFHLEVSESSHNPMFHLLVRAFEPVIRQNWRAGWLSRRTADERQAMIANHDAIAAAISAGEPDAAARAMADHFDNSTRALLRAGIG